MMIQMREEEEKRRISEAQFVPKKRVRKCTCQSEVKQLRDTMLTLFRSAV